MAHTVRVVITDNGYHSYNLEKSMLNQIGAEVEVKHCTTEDDVIVLAKDADGVIVRQQPMPGRVIDALGRCRVIARYGVGTDNVDIKAATARGIVVANVRNYANDEVAEHAIALLLDCARKLTKHDRSIRAGKWDIGQQDPIYRVSGKVLGLVGYGMIARSLHRKISGFDMEVLVYDPYLQESQPTGIKLVDLETLLTTADFISLHAPATSDTMYLVNSSTLKLMKPSAILINTARGTLVDTAALKAALENGKIAAAGIDAHEQEPPPPDYSLFGLDNVVISDHKGWYSEESISTLQSGAASAVVAVLTGQIPDSVVNSEVYDAPAFCRVQSMKD
jgi:D-3-phosphoglycerate dehydrogenase